MKNKFNYILIVVCLMFSMSSCSYFDDLLDEESDSTASLLETVDQCDLVLNGMSQFTGAQTYLLSDDYDAVDIVNMYGVNGNTLSEIYYLASFEFVKNDKSKEGLISNDYWVSAYRDIWNANVVLENIDEVKGDNEVKRNQIKGEAFLYRAFGHYMLCKNYGIQYNSDATVNSGVPLSLKFDSKAKLSRASVEEVYVQVEKDINDAMKYMTTESQQAELTYRGSLLAAKALLMELYLDKAAVDPNFYKDVIRLGEEVLQVQDFLHNYNDSQEVDDAMDSFWTNREIIMTRRLAGAEAQFSQFFNDNRVGYPFLLFSPEIKFENEDARIAYTYSDPKLTQGRYTMRFDLKFNKSEPINTGLTTAGVYLNLMEAYLRTGEDSKALPLYNMLRENRLANYSAVTKVSLDDVKKERRLEFIGTGRRFYDIKRYRILGEYQKPIVRRTKEGVEVGRLDDDSHFAFPLPLDVLRINTNIKQNIYK